jgi:hypothetical protein
MGAGSSSISKDSRTTVAVATAASFFKRAAHASTSASPTAAPATCTHTSPTASHFAQTIDAAARRDDDKFLRRIFDVYADSNGKLSSVALMSALNDVAAPVLAAVTAEEPLSAAEQIFRRADANLNGDVDFIECGTYELLCSPSSHSPQHVLEGGAAA